jgi:hypothetical protein
VVEVGFELNFESAVGLEEQGRRKDFEYKVFSVLYRGG